MDCISDSDRLISAPEVRGWIKRTARHLRQKEMYTGCEEAYQYDGKP